MKYQGKTRPQPDDSQLVFGARAIIEAIRSGKEIDKLFIQNGVKSDLIAELKQLASERQIPAIFVPLEKLNRLTNKNHQGAVCFISPVDFYKIEDILVKIFEEGKTPLLLILDRITDVRNFGAIARTAECAGVHAIIVPTRGGAPVNGDAIKTSAGALYKIPVCRENNLKYIIEYLKESGVQIIACSEKTNNLYYDVDLSVPTAILMGSEEDGISPEYFKRSTIAAKIPLCGTIESLNVGVATGIILYEAVRQRRNS